MKLKQLKQLIKLILISYLFGIIFLFVGCGVTKATVAKPAAGTTTTITITTNNPMTTTVSPDVELKHGGK